MAHEKTVRVPSGQSEPIGRRTCSSTNSIRWFELFNYLGIKSKQHLLAKWKWKFEFINPNGREENSTKRCNNWKVGNYYLPLRMGATLVLFLINVIILSVKSPYIRLLRIKAVKNKGYPGSNPSLENSVMTGKPNIYIVFANQDNSMPESCFPPTSENAAMKLPKTNIPTMTVEIRNMRRLNFFIGYQGSRWHRPTVVIWTYNVVPLLYIIIYIINGAWFRQL